MHLVKKEYEIGVITSKCPEEHLGDSDEFPLEAVILKEDFKSDLYSSDNISKPCIVFCRKESHYVILVTTIPLCPIPLHKVFQSINNQKTKITHLKTIFSGMSPTRGLIRKSYLRKSPILPQNFPIPKIKMCDPLNLPQHGVSNVGLNSSCSRKRFYC